MSRRLCLLIALSSLIAVSITISFPTVVAIASTQPGDDVPNPLPHDCDGVAAFGDTIPACCAFGYVYFEGQPVDQAALRIESAGGLLETTTEAGPVSPSPHFLSALSASPLSVQPGQWITLTATISGAQASASYQVASGGQQVDVVIPAAAGDQPPVATINYIHAAPPQPGLDTITFFGSGADADTSGAGIAAWQWISDLDGPLSSQQTFSIAASGLATGTHAISLQVQDDEGNWSPAVTREAEIAGYELVQGWNVLVPPADHYDAANLLAEIAAQGGCPAEMDRWIARMGNWSGFIPGLPFGNFPVLSLQPYFVRLNCDSSLRLLAHSTAQQSDEIVLRAGWNFLALPACALPLSAEQACQQIDDQGGAAVEIARWNAATGDWASHPCGAPIGNFEMALREGYFIRNDVESVWAGCSP